MEKAHAFKHKEPLKKDEKSLKKGMLKKGVGEKRPMRKKQKRL